MLVLEMGAGVVVVFMFVFAVGDSVRGGCDSTTSVDLEM